MDKYTELLKFEVSSPINISIFSLEKLERHWHNYLELIYVLFGELKIQFNNMNTYNLHQDDIVIINSFDIHTLYGNNCKILSLKINISSLDPDVFHLSQEKFDCNSAIESDKSKFLPLKKLIAQIIKTNVNNNKNTSLINKSYVYELLYILSCNFKLDASIQSKEIDKNTARIETMLNYINNNYNKKLSIKDLKDELFISAPYISKIFKDFTGFTFSEYLTDVRLAHAVIDLHNLNYKIEYIAEKNGFSNTRSFVSSFKNKYNCLPNKYRKDLNSSLRKNNESDIKIDNYLNLHHINDLNILAKYLKDTDYNITNNNPITMLEISSIDTSIQGTKLNHTFKKLITIGSAKQILTCNHKEMLSEIQKEIGFEYIRFHGILNDEIMIYSEDDNGNPDFCFTYVDMIIDFLLSINLKPFIELSFMPKQLAATPDRTVFFLNSIVSMPKDINKWNLLIENLIKHLINRYGKKQVESWKFFLWSEPDVKKLFGFENKDDFFNLYKETYNTVKRIDSYIQFGSSPVFSDTLAYEDELITYFKEFCIKNNCIPDYINFHFYPMNLSNNTAATLSKEGHAKMEKHLVYHESEDTLNEYINTIKNKLKKYSIDPENIYLIGWNSSISHNELLNDTSFKGAYIAKNILENYDSLKSFGYWQISDFTDEVKINNHIFQGGQGLFTYNGIKKSHYYVFKLLSKLGNNLLKSGKNFFITSNDNKIIL